MASNEGPPFFVTMAFPTEETAEQFVEYLQGQYQSDYYEWLAAVVDKPQEHSPIEVNVYGESPELMVTFDYANVEETD